MRCARKTCVNPAVDHEIFKIDGLLGVRRGISFQALSGAPPRVKSVKYVVGPHVR